MGRRREGGDRMGEGEDRKGDRKGEGGCWVGY